ncbi:hypothetical protein [Pseudonocardia sp. TRM90224]|uniref:hypothetical protein n=1 Tax=Pseudonocardia sp. TRM90224 TaxID=2812678 RepID=UPI001E3151CE|nr:hypothetical protein [Pseudonocardia sp. TRM90224]
MAARRLDGLSVRLLEEIGRHLWGFPPRLMSYIVAHLGAVPALVWFVRNMPRYERTLATLGPLRTHLACMAISLHNGCRYCTYGHAYAADLVYLQQRDRVLPVGPRTIVSWIGVPATELRENMHRLLQEADLHIEVLWIDRTLAMARGEQRAMDREEARIAHLVRMFNVLNTVGIAGKVEPDQAHDPLNKDVALTNLHMRMRESMA